ncbi:hypothetical protein GCM10018966_034450 [Streptomyces yanii]
MWLQAVYRTMGEWWDAATYGDIEGIESMGSRPDPSHSGRTVPRRCGGCGGRRL